MKYREIKAAWDGTDGKRHTEHIAVCGSNQGGKGLLDGNWHVISWNNVWAATESCGIRLEVCACICMCCKRLGTRHQPKRSITVNQSSSLNRVHQGLAASVTVLLKWRVQHYSQPVVIKQKSDLQWQLTWNKADISVRYVNILNPTTVFLLKKLSQGFQE